MEVDAVEQRPRQSAEVTLPLSRRAHALLERRAASPARIGGGNELDGGRKVADSSDAGDGDAPIFERLAKRLQHVGMELGNFIEKEYPSMREGNLAGVRRIAAADETRHRDRVVRR